MNEGAAFRGQPLLLLGGLLLGWTVLRVMLWQPLEAVKDAGFRIAEASPAALPPSLARPSPVASLDQPPLPRSHAELRARWLPPKSPTSAPAPLIGRSFVVVPAVIEDPVVLGYVAPGVPAAAPALAAIIRPSDTRPARWSADGWLLLRDDTVTPLLSGRPSYGRSQTGAIMRYGLAPTSLHRPQIYLRASTALSGQREHEIATGVSARPIGRLPLRVAIEGRLNETDDGTRARPAAYAVTELAPFRLPAGFRAEVYAQAGYVGGAFATAFVDGQAHLERRLARRGAIEFSAGAGVWGGAQEDASRIDVGPTAIVSFRLGRGFGRIAADYRFRAAGNAEPASGPALTVSAGF